MQQSVGTPHQQGCPLWRRWRFLAGRSTPPRSRCLPDWGNALPPIFRAGRTDAVSRHGPLPKRTVYQEPLGKDNPQRLARNQDAAHHNRHQPDSISITTKTTKNNNLNTHNKMATKQQKHADNTVADRLKTLYDLQKVLTNID